MTSIIKTLPQFHSILPEDSSLTIVRRSSSKREQYRSKTKNDPSTNTTTIATGEGISEAGAETPGGSGNHHQVLDLRRFNPTSGSHDSDPFHAADYSVSEYHATEMQATTTSGDELDDVDLATDNLPAVDTPDACDKAAIRYVALPPTHLQEQCQNHNNQSTLRLLT